MATQIDSSTLFELLDEIIAKLGYGTLVSVDIQTSDFHEMTIKR